MSSNLVVATVAAGAAVSGAAVGAFSSAVTERRRLRQEREQRWEERRLNAYVEFLDAARAFSDSFLSRMETTLGGDGHPEKVEAVARETTAYHSTLTRVRLVTSDPVWEAALRIDAAYTESNNATFAALQSIAAGKEHVAAEGEGAGDPLAGLIKFVEDEEASGALEKADSGIDEAINEFSRRVAVELGIPRNLG